MAKSILKFEDIDTDHSGDITLDKLQKAMHVAKPSQKDRHAAIRFGQLDVHGTGHITEEDYNEQAAVLEVETNENGLQGGKTIRLHAKSMEEMQEWGQAIEDAIFDAKAAAEKV